MNIPNCPKCDSDICYEDRGMFVCPMCGHEFNNEVEIERVYKDINGNILNTGDSVTVVRDLKLGSATIKRGTKVKKIRLVEPEDGVHDIECKIDGFGQVLLKTSVVKKAN